MRKKSATDYVRMDKLRVDEWSAREHGPSFVFSKWILWRAMNNNKGGTSLDLEEG